MRSALPDTELRLLYVFQAVVRRQGFSAAQSDLGLSPATISNHIAHLESRLGVRLCNRGRRGFSLTDEGSRIYEASLNLFRSVENFTSVVSSVRGELRGTIHFATVDAMYTNADIGLHRALGEFARLASKVVLHLDLASPQELRQRLLDGRYQLVLTPSNDSHPSIVAKPVFEEEQSLLCGRGHPLFAIPDKDLSPAALTEYPYVARSYMEKQGGSRNVEFRTAAVSSHMESLALLIHSGAYIGYLPSHFAQPWVDKGQMRPLLTSRMSYSDTFYLAHLATEQNRATKLLGRCVMNHCASGRWQKPSPTAAGAQQDAEP